MYTKQDTVLFIRVFFFVESLPSEFQLLLFGQNQNEMFCMVEMSAYTQKC